MLLSTDGLDCGFLFVPSCLLYGHFCDMQNNYLPQNIVVAIYNTLLKLWCEIHVLLSGTGSLRSFFIPPASTNLKGGYTGVTLSICPSNRLSVCGQNRVCSVSSTILIGSIGLIALGWLSIFQTRMALRIQFLSVYFVNKHLNSVIH